LQQEERFSKKIKNLENKLAAKNDELQDLESAVQQLRHDLKTVQHEKVREPKLPLKGPDVQSVDNAIWWIKYYPMPVSNR